VVVNAGNAQSERSADAAGRRQYSIDGTGGYIRARYDGELPWPRCGDPDDPVGDGRDRRHSRSAARQRDRCLGSLRSWLRRAEQLHERAIVSLERPFDAQLTETTRDGAGRC
jgi:hypothetical protein